LNGDSIPDAVFGSEVWLNNGTGNLTKSDIYLGTGLYPGFADLNGDGFVDIMLSNLKNGTYSSPIDIGLPVNN
jgi:hypothetical protein